MDNRTDISGAREAGYIAADATERAKKIQLFLFDVDGVLTDGTIWFFPTGDPGAKKRELSPNIAAVGSSSMVEVKGFSAHDGIGFALARRAGMKTGVITKRMSRSLAMRARDLHMDYVKQGVERKFEALRQILAETGLAAAQVCCMGDDIIDIPMLRNCGLAAAPANAREEVRQAAHFVALHAGGAGAARDIFEFVLKAQGAWERVTADYLSQLEGQAVS